MKRMAELLFSLLLACGILMSCDNDAPKETSKENEIIQVETQPQRDDLIKDYDQDDSQQGFSIKGQKYPYQNNDVLILDVENTTDTHYTLSFTINFYNESGDVIKTQKKTVKQFPAKHQQACLFQPRCRFASYTCEISLGEYTDTVYLSSLSCKKYFAEVRTPTKLPIGGGKYETVIYVQFKGNFGPCMTLPEGKSLRVKCDVVVVDNTGKIYKIVQNSLIFGNTDTIVTESNDIRLVSSTEDLDMPIPEELEGEITVIPIPTSFELVNGSVQ